MKMHFTAICVCVLAASGCATFSIHKGTHKIDGVRFYTKKGMLKQTTEYTRTWLVARLEYQQVEQGKEVGTPRTAEFYVDAGKATAANVEAPLASLQESPSFEKAAEQFRSALEKQGLLLDVTTINRESAIDGGPPSPGVSDKSGHVFQSLVSNSVVQEAVADYEHPYYFNTSVPPFASSTASLELANDGTLTKASATLDMTKMTELVPLKELLLGAAGIAIKEFVPGQKARVSLHLSINGYRYQLTKYYDLHEQNSTKSDTAGNQNPPKLVERVRKPLTFAEAESTVRLPCAAGTPEKDESKDAVHFNGSVELPTKK